MTSIPEESIKPLPCEVDAVAQSAPDTVWAFLPRNNDDLELGFYTITFKDLSSAVNKMARWIDLKVGTGEKQKTVAYMGRSNDIRYPITIFAAMKTGHKILLPSTRNSVDSQRHIIQVTGATEFLHNEGDGPLVESFKDPQTVFQALEIPRIENLLQGDPDPYPYKGGSGPMDFSIIIHTSGSTAHPKPMPHRNGWIAQAARFLSEHASDGRQTAGNLLFNGSSILTTLPWFHDMALMCLCKSIYCRGPLMIAPSGRTPTANVQLQMVKYGRPESALFAPSILEEIVDIPGGLETLATVGVVLFGGAPLAGWAGDRICQATKLVSVIGATENGLYDSYVQEDPADWPYFEWCPWSGMRMDPNGDLFEAVVVKRKDGIQGVFFTFPDTEEFHTKDLYKEHPQKPGRWRFAGRKDDIIVLSNGEKFNPVPFEKAVQAHPAVKAALVVGEGKFQAGVLIESNHDEFSPMDALEEIWPTVNKANERVPAHGRVWKSRIAFAPPGKAFVRTPKGTVIRLKTVKFFEDEIERLYSNDNFAQTMPRLAQDSGEATVEAVVRRAIGLHMPNVPTNVHGEADLFGYGVDSLQILGVSHALSYAMATEDGSTSFKITPRFLYDNPTIRRMVEAIVAALHGEKSARARQKPREEKMTEMIEKYTAGLCSAANPSPRQDKHTVVLTGSTGSLGNQILECLIGDPTVAKIYCLNRSNDAEARQKRTFEERKSYADFSKVTFLHTSFDKDMFGLHPEQYWDLQRSVDIFIHNAWAVDFNMGLESFESIHIAGTRRCIDFSISSTYRPHIFFVSSIAAVGNWQANNPGDLVPERHFEEDSIPLRQGYGESKHVASRMLAMAANQSGIPVTIVRVGQLAGPRGEGVWNKHEWLPSLIASSKALKTLPRTLGAQDLIDWVPVDLAARTLTDIMHTRLSTQAAEPLDVFHLINPHVVRWKELLPAISDFFSRTSEMQLSVVEYDDWLHALRSNPMTHENFARLPGLKLLDFYEAIGSPGGGLPHLSTSRAVDASFTLRSIDPINRELMTHWLEQWKF